MDYVDFIVHVFSPEKRAFYGLERLRKSATTISVAGLNAELRAAIATTRAKSPKNAAIKATAKKVATEAAAPKKAVRLKKSAALKNTATKPAAKRLKPAASPRKPSR